MVRHELMAFGTPVAIDVGVGPNALTHSGLEERRQVETRKARGLAERHELLNDGPEAPCMARTIGLQVDKGLIDSEFNGHEGNE
jgi:hypothetical protein